MTRLRRRRLAIIAFPCILSVGIVIIPVVSDYSDHLLAASAVDQTFRWVGGHLIAAMGFGVGVWSASRIVSELRRSGNHVPWMIMPLIAAGSGVYAAGLGADGIGPVALLNAGRSPVAFFDGSALLVPIIFFSATALFGVGLLSLVARVVRSGIVAGVWRYVVFVSSIVFLSAPAIPSGWALYGVAVASFGIFLPIALSLGDGVTSPVSANTRSS